MYASLFTCTGHDHHNGLTRDRHGKAGSGQAVGKKGLRQARKGRQQSGDGQGKAVKGKSNRQGKAKKDRQKAGSRQETLRTGREWLSLLYMLQEVASLGAPLFALFEHPAPRLLDGVALMMRAVAEGGVLAAAPMREAALAEGALLSHLLLACTQQVSSTSLP